MKNSQLCSGKHTGQMVADDVAEVSENQTHSGFSGNSANTVLSLFVSVFAKTR